MSYSKNFFCTDYSDRLIRKQPSKTPDNAPCVAVMTSGGDSQGMNAAVRSVVRSALHQGYRVFAIKDGYQGLCRGEPEDIKRISWEDVGGIFHLGGTFLGTARCSDFRQPEGRKKVALNLVSRGINSLIIIGGDGSLTGASILWKEWEGFLKEIVGSLSESEKQEGWYQTYWNGREKEIESLSVVGLVGSIDNDMGSTEMTIGCDSALHRICDAVDTLASTAASHQRVFVVEVMGRRCGWLAVEAAICCSADWVFLPENPASDDWREQLVSNLNTSRSAGQKRCSIIIIAEGAVDSALNKINAEDVRSHLQDSGFDTRVTILGHVQRGGAPSFYDRSSSTILGYHAVQELVKGTAKKEPQMICVDGPYKYSAKPISECLEVSRQTNQAILDQDYSKAMRLRGVGFHRAEKVMNLLTSRKPLGEIENPPRIGVMHIGACAPGMNTAVHTIVRLSISRGYTTFGIRNGMEGLTKGNLNELSWMDVYGWASLGGAILGSSRYQPSSIDLAAVAKQLELNQIDTLVMIGGWDGYSCMHYLKENSKEFPVLEKLNVYLFPCSISNNLPGSVYSIGVDSALNSIVEAVDKIKESAVSQRRVFVIEVMGAHCGFLCTMGAFACGAEKSLIPEDCLSLKSLQEHFDDVEELFEHDKSLALLFTTEKTSKVFDTKFIAKYLKNNLKYEVRVSILGHLQQGGSPSPIDRVLSMEMISEVLNQIEKNHDQGIDQVFQAAGIKGAEVVFTEGSHLFQGMDMKNRRPEHQWWKEGEFFGIAEQLAEWHEIPEKYAK